MFASAGMCAIAERRSSVGLSKRRLVSNRRRGYSEAVHTRWGRSAPTPGPVTPEASSDALRRLYTASRAQGALSALQPKGVSMREVMGEGAV